MSPVINLPGKMTSAKFGSLTSFTHTRSVAENTLYWVWASMVSALRQISLHVGLKYTCRTISFLIQVNGFWKIKPKMCKLMAKSGLFLPIVFVNPPSWWRQKMTSWWWCHDNDVMIAATLHWFLRAMWHANHLINIHVSANRRFRLYRKNTRHVLWMKWSISIVRRDSSYKLPVSKMESMQPKPASRVAVWKISPPTFYNFVPMISISCRSSQKYTELAI